MNRNNNKDIALSEDSCYHYHVIEVTTVDADSVNSYVRRISINSGRITIFKTTLVAMGFPEFFHFLFSPEDQIFGIEPCGIDDGGAYRFPDVITREHYDFKCIDLVRFVYQTCDWKKKLTYRIPGERLAPDSRTILFDLQNALEVHEGRVKEAE